MSTSATMDFFAHQEAARRRTSLLVGYYVLAVALIILGVYLAFAGTFLGVEAKQTGATDFGRLWDPVLFMWVAGATLLVVFAGSAFKTAQLASGGEAVARMLGGRPVNPNTRDGVERKILNVVEEMAIASGIPVPKVFILDEEQGVNAFAAGFKPGNAVVAVTRGCAEQLTRDELQGVVAHEFSHIFNGDMRLNIRLMGVLHGILIIALTGYWIMRVTAVSGRSRSRNSKGNGAALALLGVALMIIGYVGVFFGKLIKSAVSRQREFLADASAVQFTRNPNGIAGALKKIAGFSGGSRLQSPQAEEASHLYFSNGLRQSFLGLMATHPPLEERIRRIDASFLAPSAAARAGGRQSAEAPAAGLSGFAADPDDIVARVGAPGAEHLAHAQRMVAELPASLAAAAHDPGSARAVVYCLLLSKQNALRVEQLAMLSRSENDATVKEVARLAGAASALAAEHTLPLLDTAIPALKTMSGPEYRQFAANVEALVEADKQVDLFEFALRMVLKRHLSPAFTETRSRAVKFRDINALSGPLASLLSSLAYWGADESDAARRAFEKGAARLGVRSVLEMAGLKDAGLATVEQALAELELASPAIKRQVVGACTACVAEDGRVTPEEGELLRAVADSLDCPLPPFTAAAA